MKKKFLTLFFSLCLFIVTSFLLVGCTGGGDPSGDGGSSSGGGNVNPTPGLVYTLINEDSEYEVGINYSNFNINIKSLVIPATHEGLPVTRIANYAFSGCYEINSIKLPEGIKEIGANAFDSAPLTNGITLPSTLTEIGSYAFAGFEGASFTFPESVTAFGENILMSDKVKEITLPITTFPNDPNYNVSILSQIIHQQCYEAVEKVIINKGTIVPHYAFFGCNNLKEVEFKDDITEIGEMAFNLTALESFTIPNTVTKIGGAAFSSTNLKSLIIPSSVTSLGDSIVNDCNSIESLTIPKFDETNDELRKFFGIYDDNYEYIVKSLKSITVLGGTYLHEYAFTNWTSLTEINLPSTIESISSTCFEGCTSLESLTLPFVGNNTKATSYLSYVFGGTSAQDSSKIPSTLKTINILGGDYLSDNAFANLNSIEKISIPNTISYFGNNLFENTNLNNLNTTNYNGAYYIGNDVQKHIILLKLNNKNITSMQINAECKVIESNVFNGCMNLVSVNIPNSVVSIGDFAFSECYSLESLVLPEGLKEIGAYAFAYCTELKSINLPSNITDIKAGTFYATMSLDELTIPNKVENIGDYAFQVCGVTELVIPSSVKTIGSFAFAASQLTQISIPNSVTSLGEGIFSNCSSLSTVTAPFIGGGDEETDFISYWYYEEFSSNINVRPHEALKNVNITGAITKVPERAFFECINIENVNILNCTGIIDASAFEGCTSLQYISLNEGITRINTNAFKDCSSLQELTIPKSVTVIEYFSFENCSSIRTLTLPAYNSFSGISHFFADEGENYRNITTINFSCGTVIPRNFCKDLTNLENVTIPNTVVSIEKDAFMGCDNLNTYSFGNAEYLGNSTNNYHLLLKATSTEISNVNINTNCKIIYSSAFKDCVNLSSVEVPESVTQINSNCFENCSNLTEFEFPSSIKTVEPETFLNSGIITLTIPESVIELKEKALSGLNSLQTLTIPFVGLSQNPGIKQQKFFGAPFGYENYNEYETYDVDYTIQTSYEYQSETMSSPRVYQVMYFIPETIRNVFVTNQVEIKDEVFNSCDFLTSINFSNITTTIGNKVFYDCVNLTTLGLTNNIISFGEYAFENCSKITAIEYPSSMTTVPKGLFKNSGLTSFDFSKITAIEDEAFNGCLSLQDFELTTKLTTIGNEVFAYCESLTEIHIPSSVISLGKGVFFACTNLHTSTLPNNFTVLPERIYSGTKISTFTFGSKIIEIGGLALSGTQITEINLPQNLQKIDYSAFQFTNITSVEIPNTVTYIGPEAFSNCKLITSIRIPNSVTYVGDSAFSNCVNLVSVYIPGSVTYLGKNCLYNCSKIEYLTLPFLGTANKQEENAVFGSLFGHTTIKNSDMPVDGAVMQYTYTDYRGNFCSNWYYIPGTIKSLVVINGQDLPSAFKNYTITCAYNSVFEKTVIINEETMKYSAKFYNIFFDGTQEEWQAIENIELLESRNIYYYLEDSTGVTEGNYWRYVDGVPTIWNFETV